MRISLTALMLAALALAAYSGCNRQSGNDIVIGHFASMTGSEATFGTSADEGIRLAAEEINAKGGVLGRPIKVVTVDDQSKTEEAVTAVNRLINRDRAVALLGEIASPQSLAAAPVAQAAKIPMLTPASVHPDITKKGDYIFRSCFTNDFQAAATARFAMQDLGLKYFAILYDARNDFSVGLRDMFTADVKAAGGSIVAGADLSYTGGDSDFSGQLTKIREAFNALGQQGVDPRQLGIYVPGYYTEAGLICKKARDIGLNMPILGADGWDSQRTIEIGGPQANGCYFPTHYSDQEDRPEVKAFVDAYRKKYSKTPDSMAVLAYDAMRLMADAIGRAGSTDGAKIRDALAATKDFPGASGVITIDANRNARKRIVMIKIEDGKFKYVKSIQPDQRGRSASPIQMQGFIQQIINGLSIGAIYALIAVGYTMVYGVLRLINFAHGDVFMVGAMVAVLAATRWYPAHLFPSWAGLAIVLVTSMAVCAVLGFVIERIAYRPLRNQPRMTALITAIGVSMLLEFGGQHPAVFGPDPRVFPQLMPGAASHPTLWQIGRVTIDRVDVLIFCTTLALMLGLRWVVLKTRTGVALRAVSYRLDTARLMGINVNRIISFAFVLGSVLVAVAGVLVGLRNPRVDPLMGLVPGIKAFVAAVLGGIGNITGAVLGGLLLGLVEMLVIGYMPSGSQYRDGVAFVILILVLLLRPSGLLGQNVVEKV